MTAEKKKKIVKTIRVNVDKCNGCRACEVICSAFHATPKYSSSNPERSRIRVIREPLRDLFWRTGLADVSVRAIEVPTVFSSFDDYWTPFLGGEGSAPAYLASLPADARTRIRELLRARLEAYGCPIAMRARAWAVRGTNPLPEIP